jgi:hypothetical protein
MFASAVSLYCTLPTAANLATHLSTLNGRGLNARHCAGVFGQTPTSSLRLLQPLRWLSRGLGVGVARINGIEQMGHLPGLGRRTWGCIEHVQICPLASAALSGLAVGRLIPE